MLDFSQVTTQIKTFVGDHVGAQVRLNLALDEAARRLRASVPAWELTRDRIAESKTSWLVAEWLEAPDAIYPLPPRPMPHTVLAVDGSQLVSDRHDIALCYLLNVGMIALRYGTGERATLTSRPTLALPDDDLLDEFQGEQAAIAPKRLAIRRLLAEFAALTEMMPGKEGRGNPKVISGPREEEKDNPESIQNPKSKIRNPPPALALSDGTLILWLLETEREEFRMAALSEFRASLEAARTLGVPVAGYISAPGSRDVVNALRVFQCPHPKADCDRACPNRMRPKPHYVAPPCVGTEGVTDADLFALRLEPGERTALFGSSSQILKFYGPHTVRFFYLHTGREIARVEIPDWVAADPALLDLTHALCYDQACKGDGYPVALAEAHELAIIRTPERAAFFRLLEREFVVSRQTVGVTQKAVAKRARRV
jgi:hypothetical protein